MIKENNKKENEKNVIWAIGGANMDICGIGSHKLKDFDSNIGVINISPGGVVSNIARSCAMLGEDVHLVTCFGRDDYGNLLMDDFKRLGIDLTYSILSDKFSTSIYLAILDENRDMRIAMNDMRILEEMTEDVLKRAVDEIRGEDILITDTNLSPELIEFMMKNASATVVVDPVSAAKIGKIAGLLTYIDIFKPNEIEAETLTGIKVSNDDSARRTLTWFLERGVEEIIVTMADKGILLGTSEGNLWIRHDKPNMINANGGGDAFLGAYVAARHRGYSPKESVKFGIGAAFIKIESTFNQEISFEIIESKINALKIEETRL